MQGLTFFELICCLIVLGLLFLISLPSGVFLLTRNQLETVENEITMAIHYARDMALLHGSRLALAPLSGTEDWSYGMILFVDNKNHKYQPGDQVIHQWQWHHPRLRVRWRGFQSNAYLLFSSDLKHAATTGHFALLTAQSKQVKLVVNRFGRVSKQAVE
ncbi:GspH/FimT family pseudopilin [Legionella lansingensis]|nr:GspH/FimT family pseudopilin [Legionella lansingensis]